MMAVRPSAVLLLLSLGLFGGMLVGRFWSVSWAGIFVGLMLGIIGFLLVRQGGSSRVLLLVLILTGFAFGHWA